jgi:hypothetical protein
VAMVLKEESHAVSRLLANAALGQASSALFDGWPRPSALCFRPELWQR